jgi:hypothetical protein
MEDALRERAKILEDIYSNCMKSNPNKVYCSKVAWSVYNKKFKK